jgi:uncharacterized repeat protein (TIGR02543 family)
MIKRTLRFLLTFVLIAYGFNYPQNLVINEVMSSNSFTFADENGEYPDWLEIYNPGNSTVTLTGCGLSDDPTVPLKWIFPSGVIKQHAFLVIFCSGYNRTSDFSHLHTNFKISASGENLLLSNPSGGIIDQVNLGPLPPDISFGRQPDGTATWVYFSVATPGSANSSTAYGGITDAPQFSQSGGFFTGTVTISMSESTPGASVKYTLDGSEPTFSSTTYSTPIIISSTKVLRAGAFKSGFIDSRITTNTYLINEHHELPVVSISTDSANFFDWNTGIYVLGPNASPDAPYLGANFWQDWEKPIHIELFETNGLQGFSMDAGVKIDGSYTRSYPEKTLAVYARGKYGYNEIAYQLFPDLPYTSYQSFLLRNGGNDFWYAMMRDELTQTLLKESGLDVSDYRPAIVFLNGVYWGLHNLREKESEHFLAQHHGVDPNNVDRLENDAEVMQGDSINYNNMLNYIETTDMTVQAHYDSVKTMMDVDNFISYMVSEIYVDNTDWPGNNIKYWRERTSTGKWRWIVWDTDVGFGWDAGQGNTYDNLAAATATNGPSWPNPPWSTILLRRLLLNTQFKNDFINKLADYSNTFFEPTTVVNTINTLKSVIEPEMPYQYAKWGGEGMTGWNSDINTLISFANNRGQYVRQHFINKFNLQGLVNVNINVSKTTAGKVQINTVKLKSYPFTGVYFKNITITLTALPELGYKFIGWSGASNSTSAVISLTPAANISLTANFALDGNQITSPVVFTEINYNSAANSKSDDWVEIYNRSSEPINISGWDFRDDDNAHNFIIPQGTIMQPGSYLALCQTASKFTTVFPAVTNYLGSFTFGLSSTAEQVRLFDTNMNLIDSVAFTGTLPWDTLANGKGPTLSLKNPFMDNTLPSNWSASSSSGHGSPGVKNDNYISRGDIDSNGFVQAYDASLVLQEVVGLISPFVPGSSACWAADINQDGMIGAYDASWILNNVAYGNLPDGTLPKTMSAGGTLAYGDIQMVQNSDYVNVPVYLSNPRNVLSVYLEININEKEFELKDVSNKLSSMWQMAYHYVDNKLKIALSGIKPVEAGNIITIGLRVKDKNSSSQIFATGKLNDNLNSDPGTMVVNNIPLEFGMDQNYPNPFNPNTKIAYRLASKEKALLEIFNTLGEKVKTLVNAEQKAGFFSVNWDGTNDYNKKVSSGIYIYRLSAGKFASVKKMTLVK